MEAVGTCSPCSGQSPRRHLNRTFTPLPQPNHPCPPCRASHACGQPLHSRPPTGLDANAGGAAAGGGAPRLHARVCGSVPPGMGGGGVTPTAAASLWSGPLPVSTCSAHCGAGCKQCGAGRSICSTHTEAGCKQEVLEERQGQEQAGAAGAQRAGQVHEAGRNGQRRGCTGVRAASKARE
jgi:hypothetical protein